MVIQPDKQIETNVTRKKDTTTNSKKIDKIMFYKKCVTDYN